MGRELRVCYGIQSGYRVRLGAVMKVMTKGGLVGGLT